MKAIVTIRTALSFWRTKKLKQFRVLFLLLLFCTVTSSLQAQKRVFVRVFDSKGMKIARGQLKVVTDSSLIISRKSGDREVVVSDIGSIRLRRSTGNSIVTAAAVLGASGAVIGGISSTPESSSFIDFTPAEGAVLGLVLGTATGAVTGLVISSFRRKPLFIINQNRESWMRAKAELEQMMAVGP